MSRLPAPGFSRLKAPGFTRPPTQQQAPAVVPDDKADIVFKKPQDVPIPSAQASMGLAQSKPRNNVAKTRMLAKPTYGHSPATSVNTFQHGPSPYDRTKPNVSQIPYIGKRRVTGALKAPESRLPKHPIYQAAPLNNQICLSAQKNIPSASEQKPIRRQLIPDGRTQSKLVQPKSQGNGTKERPKSCLVQPRAAASKSSSDAGTLSAGRGLSRSLQTLPQGVKPRNTKNESLHDRSVSQETLNGGPNLVVRTSLPKSGAVQVKSKMSSSTGSLNKFGAASGMTSKSGAPPNSRNKFGGHIIRPRVSTLNNSHNTTVNISTPCHLMQPPGKEHLKQLKISPIVSSEDPNTTFDVSHANLTNTIDETHVVVEDKNHNETSIFDSSDMQFTQPVGGLNATYNQEAVLDRTNLIRSESIEEPFEDGGKTDPNLVNLTVVVSSEVVDNVEPLNETHVVSQSTTQRFDETRTISYFDDGEFNESKDFIGNETMPKHLGDDTPYKSAKDESTLEASENSFEFTEDILKVIAAISSGVKTVPSEVATVTTSPMKQSVKTSASNKSSMYNVAEAVTGGDAFVNGTSLCDGLDFADGHFGTSPEGQLENVTLKNEEETERTLHREVVGHDDVIVNTDQFENRTFSRCLSDDIIEEEHDDVVRAKSLSLSMSPRTPPNDGLNQEFHFDHRANTVTLGMLSRNSFKEGKFSKIIRRNTFASQDLMSKFRVPKEMHVTETLEGNIMMDNTTFLNFSNDVRSMKTQLLKLKRTLLEADCPSPLMKTPLKRSNSCVTPKTPDNAPPLTPRACLSSPMAVVDPLVLSESIHTMSKEKECVPDKDDQLAVITNKFQDSLRRMEEMEKEIDCHKFTIKLLQTQLEKNEQNEADILEENIILREEVGHLTERLQKLNENVTGDDGDRLLSSGSYKEEFDLVDMNSKSRKVVLQRLYSSESNTD